MKKLLIAFAAFSLFAGTSCSKFDDSKLNGRIDDLEGRVDSIEDEIEQLKQNIDGFNNTLKEFTNILNGSIITDVKRNSADNGWLITIQNVQDQTTSTFEVMDGSQGPAGPAGPAGPQGPQGDPGENGHTPVITTDTDENGTFWVIDGEPTDPKVYATGEKGEAGKTPQLAIAADNGSGAPDFNNEGEDLYWWVSYDYPGTGDKSGYEWTKLYTANTTAVKLNLTVEYKDGELIFYNEGIEIGRAEVQLTENDIAVSYTVDEDEFDEFGTLRFSKGAQKVVAVEISGTVSENVVVKADLQNNNGSFAVEVDDENNITVTSLVSGATNKLLVEVLDGSKCYHSWIKLDTNIPAVTVSNGGTHHIAYNIDGTYDVEFDITLDIPAVEDITFTFTHLNDRAPALGSNLTNPEPATIQKGQTSTTAKLTVNRQGLTANTAYNEDYYSVDVTSGEAVISYPYAQFTVTDEPVKLELTVENFTCPFTLGNSLPNICDGDLGTGFETNYTSSNFTSSGAFASYMSTIAEWGVYIDVKLPESVYAIAFGYCHRSGTNRPANANGEVGAIRIGAQTNGNYTEIGKVTVADDNLPTSARTTGNNTFTQSESSSWKSSKTYSLNGTAFSSVRFGVVEAYAASVSGEAGETGYVDARQNPWVSVAINELEVYVLK